ncbi:acyl-CoA dehydrogenase family protein [Microlunatus panaciterrae]|uniref:Alkylation response protein AidB-like acyl-CoA dehydrogenase n=1 Tax=Microlunatus panaciterrae TaxID=400768 RepID=A0ABS2RPK8_9ACTN|nr:acyl-CoA dehydrogenase family protein [Microlunatus panaciterrae]MBM7799879.1 alkylation response protein AidB-like acyl-CoA dehydrogenase [Microlunatus panaciterrae]
MRRTLFDEDHEAFRDSCRTFVDRQLRPQQEKHIANHEFGREMWLEMGKQHLLGLNIPEEYGGAGVDDPRFSMILAEELSKLAFAYSSCVGIHADCVAPYLVDLCTEEQKQRWLPRFCTGELVTAIGMTEPSGGSDLAALRTTAVRDGDDWIVNGSKTFITNGYSADLVLVAARTSPEKKSRGITLFAIETGMPGFERGRKLDKVGQPESDTAELFFADVRVPAANVIGEVDQGFIYMMQRLVAERIGAAVSNIAHARQILGETLAYVKERKAFGQPVGSFQHNKFVLAELVTSCEVTQAFVDACILEQVSGTLGAVDAAKAKWWTSQVQNDVLDACVQLYGGYGYMNEYRVARAWADARVTKIWAGSNEIMKELIGRDLGL